MITNFSSSSIRTGVKRKRFWDQNAVANSYFSIATSTVGAGGASSVTFSSIPQTYTHLQIRAICRLGEATTDNNIYMQFNGDTAANYSNHYLYGSGSGVASGAGVSSSNNPCMRCTGSTSTANMFGAGVIDILDYANTNKYKTLRSISGNDQNGSGFAFLQSGNWRSTSAITSVSFVVATSNIAVNSSFALYGVLA